MTDKTDTPKLRRFNFEIWPHEAYISEEYDGEYVLFADAHQQIEAANREIAALKSKDISCTLGVGDGSGGLFVHGNYDSIKATQEIIIERDALKGRLVSVLPKPISITDVILKVDTEQNAKWNGRIGFMAGWNACRDAAISSGYRIPLQTPCINKEKLCDWLEDNFDIDDSQRDAFAACFAHCCDCIVKDGQS